jgi:hypothetical protein
MKRLLLGIYIYMGVFFGICLVVWTFTGNEPATLIAGVSAAVGVESIAAGIIRINENREQHKYEKEMQYGTEQHDGTGYGGYGGDQLEAEVLQPEVSDDGISDGDPSGGDAV